MPHTTSRIPAAIDALYAAANAAFGATTTVVDGPPLQWAPIEAPVSAISEDSWLFIGARPEDDSGADGTEDYNAAGAVSMDERFNVPCTAVTFAGDEEMMKAPRDAAFALIAALDLAIRADPTLGGAVLYAHVASVDHMDQMQTKQGPECQVIFTVACRSYLD